MTGGLPLPDDMSGLYTEDGGGLPPDALEALNRLRQSAMGLEGERQTLPYMIGQGGGALPPPGAMPGGLSSETRTMLMDQIKRLSQPAKRQSSLWTDPAFLAGLTLLGGGNMGQAGMAAARAQMHADQTAELGDAKRANALASLTGRLAEADKASLLEAKGKREAIGKALALVPPTQRGRLGKLITDTGTDPTDPLALQALIEQNQIPMAPNFKAVAGVGLVDMAGEQPKVVVPVQHAPHAPPADIAEYEYAKGQGFKGSIMDYQKQKKGGDGPFSGNAMEAQAWNIVSNPNADRSSPAYISAYSVLTQPKPMPVPDKDGNMVMSVVTPTVPFPAPIMPSQPPAPPASPDGAPPPQPGAPPRALNIQPIAPPAVDKAAKAKMDKAITEAATLSNALNDYVEAFEKADAGERISSVAGTNTPLNTAYSNAALLAKGEELYNLGVLNGPDLTIIQKTLADPSTIKGQFAGPEAAKAAATAVRRLIQDRINSARQQQNLPPLDIFEYGQKLRSQSPGQPAAGKGGRFATMSPAELAKVDVQTLSPADLEAFIEATK